MGRYSKSYSNFILMKKHQNVNDGAIFERDWVTIGNVHRLEPGKKAFFGEAGFIFTDNGTPFFKKRHDYGKWVAHFVYDDVKDVSSRVNEVILNTESDDLRFYAYYGSMSDLVRTSVENIVATFPGLLRLTNSTLFIQDADGSMYDTGYYIISNDFGLDLHTETSSIVDFDNILRYLTASWDNYVVTVDGAEEGSVETYPVVGYTVTSNIDEILESSKYYDLGYDFLYYKNSLYKWNTASGRYEEVSYSDDCTNYFIKCDEYLKYGDEYYEWSDEYGHYIPMTGVYELCDDNNQKLFTIEIEAENGETYTILMYRVNNVDVYCLDAYNSTSFITIQPNKSIIDGYFETLSGFERKLLNRKSKPLYTNRFKVPYKLPNNGYTLVDRLFTWPSNGYCIDASSAMYASFVGSLIDMAETYDELYSDCIWRCMTHESIKNFDWTYRRRYEENDEQDNIEGGERMMEFLRFYGRVYDEVKMYIEGINATNNVSYDGYRNVPDAELSDKNNVHGWDIVSTIWEPYYYVEIEEEDIPEGVTIVPLPTLPVNINSESPEYVSIGCNYNSGETLYYHKEYENPSDAFLTEEFLKNEDYIIGKYDSWITYNHNTGYSDIGCQMPEDAEEPPVPMGSVPTTAGEDDPEYISVDGHFYHKGYLVYQELGYDPMKSFPPYWAEYNTTDVLPSDLNSNSPQYLRVYGNGGYRYYVLTDNGFNNKNYLHANWFNARTANSTTPISTDIDFQRRLFLSTNRIFKTKGTIESIEMVMGMFGYGNDGEYPDYHITEYYAVTIPIKATDIFYFYSEIENGPNNSVPKSSLEAAIENIGPGSPKNIKITQNGVTRYYVLNDEYTFEEMVVEFARHKTESRLYNDEYSGVPLYQMFIDNDKYLIPYYTGNREYDGYLYFQQKGGWGKWSPDMSFKYDYSETVPYLHMLPDVESLMSLNTFDLEENDVFYVFDTTDYVNYDEDIPLDLSHFFKVSDKYNPQLFSSWKNIPMDGTIVYDAAYDKDGVTHEDYLHAKYLNDIIPTILFNNPHTGNGAYDCGEEFFEYMHTPYKYLFENYGFDDEKYNEIAEQFRFTIERHTTDDEETPEEEEISYEKSGPNAQEDEEVEEDNDKKVRKALDTFSYKVEDDEFVKETNEYDKFEYFINSKVLVLKNNINNPFHKKFMKDVVLKYVMQVIPSTTILILEDFNILPENDVKYYNVQTAPGAIGGHTPGAEAGTTSGDGTYVEATYAVLKAYPKEGYHFYKWEDARTSETVSTEPLARVLICKDSEYIAWFAEDCVIDTMCKTVCEVTIGCEPEENCSITLVCDMDEEKCDMDIDNCETETMSDLPLVEIVMEAIGVSDGESAANVLSKVCVLDNSCDAYETAMSSASHVIANPTSKDCLLTEFPITEDMVDVSDGFKTVVRKKLYNANEAVSFCWATTDSADFVRWEVGGTTYTSGSITLNLQPGTTRITAIFRGSNV